MGLFSRFLSRLRVPFGADANHTAQLCLCCLYFDGLSAQSGVTNSRNGQEMRPLLALLLIAPMLAGCLERGPTVAVDNPPAPAAPAAPDDDIICRANNTERGSPAYITCRRERDAARAKAEARADRAQRNLGEQMLNNPVRP
jgi:hypothetical protein